MKRREINLQKVKYDNKNHAKVAIKEHLNKYNQKMKMYRCRCDGTKHYHLTSHVEIRAIIMRTGEIIEEIT